MALRLYTLRHLSSPTTASTPISKPMAQIRHVLFFQPRVAFADKLHIAVNVLENKIKFFGIDLGVDAREGNGEFSLGIGTGVGDMAVEIRVVQGVPEAFGFRAGCADAAGHVSAMGYVAIVGIKLRKGRQARCG
ncbi:MAG: hypothetical protein DSZ28_03030, partial [Thiothrix sp.]